MITQEAFEAYLEKKAEVKEEAKNVLSRFAECIKCTKSDKYKEYREAVEFVHLTNFDGSRLSFEGADHEGSIYCMVLPVSLLYSEEAWTQLKARIEEAEQDYIQKAIQEEEQVKVERQMRWTEQGEEI